VQWIRGLYRGGHSGDRREAKVNHGDAVARFGHVAQGRTTAVAGELISTSRKARGGGGGYDGESPEWRPAHGFYLAVLSGHWWRKSQRRQRESWRISVVGGEGLPRWRSDLEQALYHGEGH
jgi:hypothetical protein